MNTYYYRSHAPVFYVVNYSGKAFSIPLVVTMMNKIYFERPKQPYMFKQLFTKFSLAFLALLLFQFHSQAQLLDSLLNVESSKYPQEKIYMQFDRPYYNPGETIWFKAYLFTGAQPSFISKTMYAELLNDKGVILQRKVMPVISCGAASAFDIPDSLKNNFLYVKAYTAWMLNFDASLLYYRPLRILQKATAKNTAPKTAFSVSFFPEGGDLVATLKSFIAFKATDQDAKPISISGSITDHAGKEITTFKSTHDGMGMFELTPAADEQYAAKWKDNKGIVHETSLPAVKKTGATLSMISLPAAIQYNIERPANAAEDLKFFYVIAQTQQQLIYSAKINLSVKTRISAPIPIDSIADGIVQITIFDATQKPVAERLVFVNHNNYAFPTDLHAVQLDLNKRKSNTLQVDVGGTFITNLSIAVTDDDLAGPLQNNDNIFSTVLLSSDLKGNIYNPSQYFVSDEDSLKEQLDLVMMTNGWRRFKWEERIAGKFPLLKYAPENNLSVSGTVFGPTKTQLKGKELTGILKTKNGGSEIFSIPVNADGSFRIDQLILFDTAKMYYQFNGDKDKTLTNLSSFRFNGSYLPPMAQSAASITSLPLPASPDTGIVRKNNVVNKLTPDQFFEGNKIRDLSVVTVKAKIKSPEEKMNEAYTSGFFTGSDGYTFIAENDPFAKSAFTVLDYLMAKVAGLQISTSGEGSVTWRGSNTSLFLNEATADINLIKSIPMNDVAMVKVFRPPFFGAAGGGAGGAVAVYTKRGADVSTNVKGLESFNVNGYSAIREFYSPDYNDPKDFDKANDRRITLYWNPNLFFDKTTRRIKIPFFNSDNCKKIRVIIEGINADGQLTHEEKVFQ